MASPIITSPSAPDLDKVRSWLESMLAALRFGEVIVAILTLIGRMRDINLELVKQMAHLRRARPRSETFARLERQLTLPLAGLDGRPLKPPDEANLPERKRKRRARGRSGGRGLLPAHLPRIEVVNPVPAAQRICPQCGRMMTTLGHDVCESLDIVPARIVVVQRKDERVACPYDDTIVSAKAPPRIVEGGKLGDALIVEALADKYIDKLPVERQSRRWEHAGVDLAPQTLGRSMAAAIDLLAPVARAIHHQTRASELLATDATGLPVLDQDHPQGIRNGTMWCWVGDGCWVSFFYSPIGDSKSVKDFLGEDLCRVVQCDGTSILAFLERAGGKRPGCWSHGRRRFVEAACGGEALALVALKKIRRLFAVERLSAKHSETTEQRLLRRRQHSAPVLADLRTWITEQRNVIPPKSPLGKALGYLHRQWHRLVLFLDDGRIELTNNRVERELRSLVLGRKNWLFAYGDLGGARAATILTILGSCIAHRLSPRAYLHAVTRRILHGWPNARLRELLPDRIVDLHPELRLPPRARYTLPASKDPASAQMRAVKSRQSPC
jgi:transposase